MVAPINPNGVGVQGNIKVIWVETLTNPDAPTTAEIGAGTSLDVSYYLYSGGWAPGVTSNRVTAPRRLASRKSRERFGTTTETLGDLVYVVDPQSAAGSDGKKAYEALTEGSTGYFVERPGEDADSDIVAGDFVNVYPVEVGPQVISGDPSDEAAEFQVTQPVSVTGDRKQLATVAA
jgi:hypothetical protein